MTDSLPPNAGASSSLAWMPIFVDDLLALGATLSPASLGGLMRLRAYAWRQSPPCTLPDSDARLATISGLGGDWAEHGPAIRELLEPIGDGKVVDRWLLGVYGIQLAKYISAATRGRSGGRPSKAEMKAGNKAQLSESPPPTRIGESPALAQLSRLNGESVPDEGQGKAETKAGGKLSLSSASPELSFSLSSVLSTSLTQNTDKTKAGEKPSFSGPESSAFPLRTPEPRSIEAELERRECEWRDKNPGKPLPLNFHVQRVELREPPAEPTGRREPVGT